MHEKNNEYSEKCINFIDLTGITIIFILFISSGAFFCTLFYPFL